MFELTILSPCIGVNVTDDVAPDTIVLKHNIFIYLLTVD